MSSFRAADLRFPAGVRRALRGAAKLLWWKVAFKLPRKLPVRRFVD